MTWNLFLDDERNPNDVTWIKIDQNPHNWEIARNFDDVLALILDHNSLPNKISFDHDLGREETGYTIAQFLFAVHRKDLFDITHHLDRFAQNLPIVKDDVLALLLNVQGFVSVPSWTVHSMNPIGAKNIEMLMLDVADFVLDDIEQIAYIKDIE